jgi:hypothetical protein
VPLEQKIRLLGVRASNLFPLALADAGGGAIQAELPL